MTAHPLDKHWFVKSIETREIVTAITLAMDKARDRGARFRARQDTGLVNSALTRLVRARIARRYL